MYSDDLHVILYFDFLISGRDSVLLSVRCYIKKLKYEIPILDEKIMKVYFNKPVTC
jgi:hypothetical protein